jgi:hypothetical protein
MRILATLLEGAARWKEAHLLFGHGALYVVLYGFVDEDQREGVDERH